MNAVDLFAGAGGFSTGAKQAGCNVVWAGNHWPEAVEIHRQNHPEAIHACQDLQQTDWRDVPAHDLLLASPACQGHSNARGKEKPHHDALRSTAWAVVTAAECHRPPVIVVENVKQFATKWVLYPAWCAAMTALGYAISPNVIDSADHGVPQERKRLFIVLTRSKHPLELKLSRCPHVAARSVIDFDGGTWSRVADKVPATRARVLRGRRELGARFVMPYYGGGTITTKNRWGIVDGDRMRMASREENRAFMGFDADAILPEDVTTATFMLGNAVVPKVAKDLITFIREAA